MRFYGLSEQNYWYDEFITLEVAKGSLDSIISGSRPPLYLVFAHFWIENFGISENVTRLLSIIFGVSSIVLIYFIGKTLFDHKVGALSAFFMSVSTFQIYYSQELRYYSLYELLTLISFFFYIRFLNSKSYIHLALYILSTVLLYYSHDFAVFIIAVQNLYVLIKYKTLKSIIAKWFLSQFVILLSIAPRFINTLSDKAIGEGGPNWIPPPNKFAALNTIYEYMGLKFKIHNSMFDDIAIIFLLIGTAIYFLIVGKEKWVKSFNQLIGGLKRSWNIKSESVLVILWFLVPISLVLIMSEFVKPMYLNRYLICSAPAFYILVALLITKLKKVVPIGIILIAYAILISPGLYEYYTIPVREDWREVGSYIRGNYKRNSAVLISALSLDGFDWYNKGHYKYCALPPRNIDLTELFRICKLDAFDHFWLILNNKQNNKSYESSYYHHKDSLFRIEKERGFVVSNKSPVTLYSVEKVKQ
ncbi:MAG: glycosyltransferase family 39 protein [Thermodesulfobacteriota bacterium]